MSVRSLGWGVGLAFLAFRMAAASPAPTAKEIVDRYAEARGGYEKLRGIQSIIYRGTYRENGEVDPSAAMAMMRPYYKIVGDPEKPNPEFAEGYDGSAWEFYGDFVMRTVGAAAAAARHGLAIEGPLADYERKGSAVTLMGLEKVGDRDAYRLRVKMRDGFEQDELIDAENWRLIAERKVAPIHAFGKAVASEERFGDFRAVEGVLFAFSSREVEIATGRVLNEMEWKSIVINQKLDAAAFSPPVFPHTPLQSLLEHLFAERQDLSALDWSYQEFRRAYPEVDTEAGIRGAGYHILKTGEIGAATALLQWNAADYPRSSGAAFGLGRAYAAAGKTAEARAEFERALRLDPANKRAKDALEALKK